MHSYPLLLCVGVNVNPVWQTLHLLVLKKLLFFLGVIGLSSSNLSHLDEWLNLWRHVALTCLIRTNKSTRLGKGHRRRKPLLELAYQVNPTDWLYSCGVLFACCFSHLSQYIWWIIRDVSFSVCVSLWVCFISARRRNTVKIDFQIVDVCVWVYICICVSICHQVWNRRWGCNNVLWLNKDSSPKYLFFLLPTLHCSSACLWTLPIWLLLYCVSPEQLQILSPFSSFLFFDVKDAIKGE